MTSRTLLALLALGCASRLTAADVDFNRDVRPILSDVCFACHGPDARVRKADLRLDTEAGLKQTPEEVDAFVKDQSPDAFAKVVDRLLASPHYGERMAMVWLDLVRYADSVGYHGDQAVSVSPYRDWVIKAFNANVPFDRFT